MGQELSWRFVRGQEALPEVREGSRGSPEGSEMVGRPSRLFGRGWETLREGREGLGSPPGGQEQVGRPS